MRKLNSLFDRLRKWTKADKGFTLIELVIVVAVIGLLTAIAIPAYNAPQQQASENTVKSAATTGFQAMQGYFASGDDYVTAKPKLIKLNPTGGGKGIYYTVTGTGADNLFVQANIDSTTSKPYAIYSSRDGLVLTK
jgi:prepilin-type N-terminal cleavage/methylation domain-containing protein